jgi:hypothetical protein
LAKILWFSKSNEDRKATRYKVGSSGDRVAIRLYRCEDGYLAHTPEDLCRFGIAPDYARPFKELVAEGFIAPHFALNLIEQGRDYGADPDDWFGMLRAIDVEDCAVETWTGDFPGGRWANTRERLTRPRCVNY